MTSVLATITDNTGRDVKVLYLLRDNLQCTQCSARYRVKALAATEERALESVWRKNKEDVMRGKRKSLQPVSYGFCKQCTLSQWREKVRRAMEEGNTSLMERLQRQLDDKLSNYYG